MTDIFRKAYRQLGEKDKQALDEIKSKAQALHDLIEALGASREISLAKTKLEECVMWAVKGITS